MRTKKFYKVWFIIEVMISLTLLLVILTPPIFSVGTLLGIVGFMVIGKAALDDYENYGRARK